MTADFRQVRWDAQVEDDCRQLVRLAVREDLDRIYDWTTVALVEHDRVGEASIVAREPGVVAGMPAGRTVLEEMAPSVHWNPLFDDGHAVAAGQTLARLTGPARDLLTCERILLNFLGRLSGIATLTRRYVDRIAGSRARIYDTRKTTPGWRRLEKYAVGCGGGRNHRTGLFDAVLIKDNHLALAAGGPSGRISPGEAVRRVRSFLADSGTGGAALLVEIEVDTLAQLQQVLPAGPDLVLLDNMTPDQLRQAVAARGRLAPGVELEASGGVNLETVRAIAESGVDRISVGALTHSARSLDVGMDWEE